MRIAVDLMGGDLPPEKLIQSMVEIAPLLSPHDTITLVCSEEIAALCTHLPVTIVTAPQVILPTDNPLEAVRKKPNSTMVQGIKLLANKSVNALVSLGNTGALYAASTIHLQKLAHTSRPGLLTILPTRRSPLGVIDVGGRVSGKAEHLLQSAHMGAAAISALFGIPHPRVGLLNIGEESMKGTKELKHAYHLFREQSGKHWTFSGNIEGRAVFNGDIDLLVTDGFTGNMLLKIAEGVSQFVLEEVSPVLQRDKFKQLQHRLDYREYPGAILCGVDGLVIKCHGNTGPEGITKAILEARRLIQNRFIETISQETLY